MSTIHRLQVCTKTVGFAVVATSFIGLTAPVVADGGNLPGTGPVITGAMIQAGPVSISGDTSDNTDEFDVGPVTSPPTDCGPSTAPDEWYTISIGATTGTIAFDIDLCELSDGQPAGTEYDSKIFVLDETSTPLQCNDETGCAVPGAGPSAILNLVLTPGTYEVAIDGFGTSSGVYAGELREFVVGCFLNPPCTGPAENEPCNEGDPDTVNGGCTGTTEAFSPLTLGLEHCGENWANNGTRDTDWWRFNTTITSVFEIECRALTQTVAFIARLTDGGTCPVTSIPAMTPAFAPGCGSGSPSENVILEPGDYAAFVATGNSDGSGLFDGFPCPGFGNNAYALTVVELAPPPPACPWDLNQNGDVDFADVLQVIANWGPCPSNP